MQGTLARQASCDLPVLGTVMRFEVFGVGPAEDRVAALIHGRLDKVPLVRIHSCCLTGDVLGSMKCDCGLQLRQSLQMIRDAHSGVLLYMTRHEGRGIGLVNKVHAYSLQDEGYDTAGANLALGLPVDARDYHDAADALRLLRVSAVRLLTNNPAKVQELEDAGLDVVERIALHFKPNRFNRRYLSVKRRTFGHLLPIGPD